MGKAKRLQRPGRMCTATCSVCMPNVASIILLHDIVLYIGRWRERLRLSLGKAKEEKEKKNIIVINAQAEHLPTRPANVLGMQCSHAQ